MKIKKQTTVSTKFMEFFIGNRGKVFKLFNSYFFTIDSPFSDLFSDQFARVSVKRYVTIVRTFKRHCRYRDWNA